MSIEEIVKNKESIIEGKKSVLTKSCSFTSINEDATKADEPTSIGLGDTIYPIISTTNYMDSHGDVHINGCFDETVEVKQGSIYYIINHDLAIGSVIGMPKDVSMSVESKTWKQLGRDYGGSLQVLQFTVGLKGYANDAFVKSVNAGMPIENSIRMRYDDMVLCVNNPEYKAEYTAWKKYIKNVANSDKAEKQGYFWAITKLSIEKEGSAVLFGSNNATPIQTSKTTEVEETKECVTKTPTWLNLM